MEKEPQWRLESMYSITETSAGPPANGLGNYSLGESAVGEIPTGDEGDKMDLPIATQSRDVA